MFITLIIKKWNLTYLKETHSCFADIAFINVKLFNYNWFNEGK